MAVVYQSRNSSNRALARGLSTLFCVLMLSVVAGFGSTLVSEAAAAEAQPPLIAADKAPTRVRPQLAPAGTAANPSPPDLRLPIGGIPPAPIIRRPADGRVVEAELAPALHPAIEKNETGFRLQLASLRTSGAAGREAQRLRRRFASQLTDLKLSVEPIVGARGTYYRVVSEPVTGWGAAKDHCATLGTGPGTCLVIAARIDSARPHAAVPVAQIEIDPPRPSASPVPVGRGSAAAALSRNVRAQLASLRSLPQATRELRRLRHRYAAALERTPLMVSRIDQGDRGVFYRVVTAPVLNRAVADGLCQRISSQSGCVLIPGHAKDI